MAKLTQARLREVLHYDPETGIFTWRISMHCRTQAGQVAGSLSHGYIIIGVDYVRHRAHRLAWLYVHGEWPDGGLDHCDCDRSNNRLANLRPANRTQNNGNSCKQKNNTSGFKGVSWHSEARRWIAKIQIKTRQVHLGYFDSPDTAHAAYVAAARKHFGEFARFE